MEKCKICGEWIDWDNPNIHYGGHVCNITTGKETPWSKEEINNKDKYKEAIEIIKSNYPPENYTALREALDLAMECLSEKLV